MRIVIGCPLIDTSPHQRQSSSPNATDVLADLVRIGALQLAQFGVPLDLEVHFFAGLRQHLRIGDCKCQSDVGRRAMCEEGWPQVAPDLDVNGRVCVLELGLNLWSNLLIYFCHVWVRLRGR
jgi:hypothetical protein